MWAKWKKRNNKLKIVFQIQGLIDAIIGEKKMFAS
jgi:hypothetical protein